MADDPLFRVGKNHVNLPKLPLPSLTSKTFEIY